MSPKTTFSNHSHVKPAPNLENNDLGKESDIDMEDVKGISSGVLSMFQYINKESVIDDKYKPKCTETNGTYTKTSSKFF